MNMLPSLRSVFRFGKSDHVELAKSSPRTAALAELLADPGPLDVRIAAAVAAVRERLERDATPRRASSFGPYATVGEHFSAASSKDAKLAMLEAIVRFQDAGSILEIGTAYGISAIAMALAQREPRLVTIEAFEPQATIGAANIRSVTSGVECVNERKETALPRLAAEGRRFDLVFHDGGHTGDAYVEDFATIRTMLEPASIYMIDDIAWDEGRKRAATGETSRRTCLEGWQELVADPNVEGALVCNKNLGILLIG